MKDSDKNSNPPDLTSEDKIQERPPDLKSYEHKDSIKPNRTLTIWMTLFSVLAIGIAAYFAFENFKLKSEKQKPENSVMTASPTAVSEPTSSPSTSSTPEPNSDPFKNWNTFSESGYCYTFQYPDDVDLTFQDRWHLSKWGPTQEKETEFYDGISLSFSEPIDLKGQSLESFVDDNIVISQDFSTILIPKEALSINGISGFSYTEEGLGIFKNIFLQSDDKSCTVEITDATSDPTNQGFRKTVDDIFSTFEFTY